MVLLIAIVTRHIHSFTLTLSTHSYSPKTTSYNKKKVHYETVGFSVCAIKYIIYVELHDQRF